MKTPIPIVEVKRAVLEAMPAVEPLIAAVGACPEVGFHEKFAARTQEDFLARHNFCLESGIGGISTAFWGTYSIDGKNRAPRIAILTEYDALAAPLGHACGHQLIMGAGLAALAAVRELMEKYDLPGTLCAAGCPGEEQLGGKLGILRAGYFQDVEAAILCHPFHRTGVTKLVLAVTRFNVEFFGRSAHASTSPEAGINALDALHLFFDGINAWRQQLALTSRVHGIVTNGGQVANAIPEYTSGFFYVRSADNTTQQAMEKRFCDIAQGAALMTGCDFKVTREDNAYSAGQSNLVLATAAEQVMTELGMAPDLAIPDPLSTDFANVCDAVPGVNLYFNVTAGRPVALHSDEFRKIAAAPTALGPVREVAEAMAKIALDCLTDETLRERMRAARPRQ